MAQHSLTIMTKTNGPISGRLSKAYVSLAVMPERGDRSRISTLGRYGAYEVRLVEFLQGGPNGDCLFWLELYCHNTKSSLDSFCCHNLDDAETAADYLISSANQLLRDAAE
jgi:hypothetical protein